MPALVVLRARSADPTMRAEAPGGGAVRELCDRHPGHGIPFSCRKGVCGSCLVEVVRGADACEEPRPGERELLEILSAGPDHRLGCQLRLRAAGGDVVVRPA